MPDEEQLCVKLRGFPSCRGCTRSSCLGPTGKLLGRDAQGLTTERDGLACEILKDRSLRNKKTRRAARLARCFHPETTSCIIHSH